MQITAQIVPNVLQSLRYVATSVLTSADCILPAALGQAGKQHL